MRWPAQKREKKVDFAQLEHLIVSFLLRIMTTPRIPSLGPCTFRNRMFFIGPSRRYGRITTRYRRRRTKTLNFTKITFT